MPSLVDELVARITEMDPETRAQTEADVLAATGDMKWVPQPGRQTEAYYSLADDLFYGGQAGGGKTDLILGIAANTPDNSMLARRYNKDARKLMQRFEAILGHTNGRNLSTAEWKVNGGTVTFIGFEHETDKERAKGEPHALKLFDEIGDFSESQFKFIKTWERSAKPDQRCRTICTGNPPTTAEGLWVIKYWAAWLDPTHPNPAKPGELRWYISDENGNDQEVSGPGEYQLYDDDGTTPKMKPDGRGGTLLDRVRARSRTFIRATLADNKYLGDDYAAVLDALPKELRAAYRDGAFDQSIKDNPKQVIPTAWVMAAQARWRPQPPIDTPMCAMANDPTGGGDDVNTIVHRRDWWFSTIEEVKTKDISLIGTDTAGMLLARRKDNADIVIDMSGGFGGPVWQALYQSNGNSSDGLVAWKGSEVKLAAMKRDKSGKLTFRNMRSWGLWNMREALDPDQPGGSPIALPQGQRLLGDLTAPTFEISGNVIEVESKEDVCKRLGRSTDEGDVVYMCWGSGARGLAYDRLGSNNRMQRPKIIMGHAQQRQNK